MLDRVGVSYQAVGVLGEGGEGAGKGGRFSSGGGAGIGWRRCGEEGGVSHPVFSLG